MPNAEAILRFLKEVDRDFPVPVSSKTPLEALAEKYAALGTLCCEYAGDRIIAMAAGYTRGTQDRLGYLSLVAACADARRRGLCTRLVREFLQIAADAGLRAVHLYTHRTNVNAIAMYRKLGFTDYHPEAEPRPEDVHLIRRLEPTTPEAKEHIDL